MLRRSVCEPIPSNLGRQCQGDSHTLYSEGERKLGSRACNTSFQVSDWSHFLSNHSFKGKLWLSLEHILFAFHSGYANERWVPAPAPHAQRAPKPASTGVYPGPSLHVFWSSRLWAGFLWGTGFVDCLRKRRSSAFDTRHGSQRNIKWKVKDNYKTVFNSTLFLPKRDVCVCVGHVYAQKSAYTKIMLTLKFDRPLCLLLTLFLSMFSEISVRDVWRKNKEINKKDFIISKDKGIRRKE